MDNYWIWCGSVIKGEDNLYHMFASRWPKELGFGAHWLFNCEIVRASSDIPQGSYKFEEVVLSRRDRKYFDGMNVHYPSIRKWNNKYYLYYMGTTYGGPIPRHESEITSERFTEVWNNKRIGLAVSDSSLHLKYGEVFHILLIIEELIIGNTPILKSSTIPNPPLLVLSNNCPAL